jgi:formamidopyrimidine-DNA glycosylase
MPELPEVESVKLQLQKFLIGHTIEDVSVVHKGVLSGDTKDLIGGEFKGVKRFGKALVINLNNGYSMVIHIKLTGQLVYRGPKLRGTHVLSKKVVDGLGGRHTHVIFLLDKEGRLYYNDVRKFGWIKIVKTKDVPEVSYIKKLGPEPLGHLSIKEFAKIVSGTRRPVKVVIMDQTKMGGVGNIYANDALFLARIDPKRPASGLGDKDASKLFRAIETVLKKGLKYGGASELSFVTPDGLDGEYQEHTLVYGQEGSVCKHGCGGKIEKYMLGGRGTYWCPTCQV